LALARMSDHTRAIVCAKTQSGRDVAGYLGCGLDCPCDHCRTTNRRCSSRPSSNEKVEDRTTTTTTPEPCCPPSQKTTTEPRPVRPCAAEIEKPVVPPRVLPSGSGGRDPTDGADPDGVAPGLGVTAMVGSRIAGSARRSATGTTGGRSAAK